MAVEPRKGLLVDWGGVMTTNLFTGFAAFCEAEGLEPSTVADAFRSDPAARTLLEDFECGRIAEDVFQPGLARVLGVASHEDLIVRMFSGIEGEPAMLDAVRGFKRAGVRTGLLSNSWGGASYDRTLFPELFDVLVISGELGMRKPDPAIYDLAADRMGLPPSQLVFVDDLPFNLKPARELGMATVHHTDSAGTIAQLEELLGVTVSV